MASEKYLAIDIGASSGRAIVGTLEDGKITLEEMHRFENGPTERGGSLYWNIESIFAELKEGVRKSLAKYPDIKSMGIDTWGVDYVIVKPDGSFAREPYNYRDSRTDNVPEEVFKTVPEAERLPRLRLMTSWKKQSKKQWSSLLKRKPLWKNISREMSTVMRPSLIMEHIPIWR